MVVVSPVSSFLKYLESGWSCGQAWVGSSATNTGRTFVCPGGIVATAKEGGCIREWERVVKGQQRLA